MAIARLCIECPEIALAGQSRCARCSRRKERARNGDPKRQAYRDPLYRAQVSRGTCWLCGKPGADTRDHVVPVAIQMTRWGQVLDHRARPAHRACNSGRGAKS